ncbi:MAG: DUF1501 domain-containing protein [Myxococcota bacterium]
MPLTRRHVLLGGAAATVVPRGALGAASGGGAEFLVVLFANGGWDVTFAMDPKPRVDGGPVDGPWVDASGVGEDTEEVRVLNGIPVQCNDARRRSVTGFFETWGDRTCVVNGIWTGSIVHQPSRIRMLTGTQHPDRADFATIVGAARGVSVDLPLGTVDFSGLGYSGPYAATTGRIGYSSQLKALLDDGTTFPAPSWADYTLPTFSPTSEEEEALQAHLAKRLAAWGEASGGRDAQLVADIEESWGRRQRLIEKADTIAGRLSLGGQPSLDLQADVAVDLLLGGVCHTVTLASSVEGWDTHDLNALQHDQFQSFFTSLNRLCDNLHRNGLLDRTLVVVASEMTRTPRRNYKTGKDHWSHTSQLWIGGGVRGGRVAGATNGSLESQPVDLDTGEVTAAGVLNKYDNVVAGILEHMGVDAAEHLPGVVPFRGAR